MWNNPDNAERSQEIQNRQAAQAVSKSNTSSSLQKSKLSTDPRNILFLNQRFNHSVFYSAIMYCYITKVKKCVITWQLFNVPNMVIFDANVLPESDTSVFEMRIVNISTATSFKNASALWIFYCSHVNVFWNAFRNTSSKDTDLDIKNVLEKYTKP